MSEPPQQLEEKVILDRLSNIQDKKAKLSEGIINLKKGKKNVVDTEVQLILSKLESSLEVLTNQEDDYLQILAHIKTMTKMKSQMDTINKEAVEKDIKENIEMIPSNCTEPDTEEDVEALKAEILNVQDAMIRTETAAMINEQLVTRLKLQNQKRAALAGINLKKKHAQAEEADQATEQFLGAQKTFLTQRKEIEKRKIQLEKLRKEVLERELGERGTDFKSGEIDIAKNGGDDQPHCSTELLHQQSVEECGEEESDKEVEEEKEDIILSLTELKERRDAFNKEITAKLKSLDQNKKRMKAIKEKLTGLQDGSIKATSSSPALTSAISANMEAEPSTDEKSKFNIDYKDALTRLQSLTTMRQRLEMIQQNLSDNGIDGSEIEAADELIKSIPDIILDEVKRSSPPPDAALPKCFTNALDEPTLTLNDRNGLASNNSSFEITTIENVKPKPKDSILSSPANILNQNEDDTCELINEIRRSFDEKMKSPQHVKRNSGFWTSFSTVEDTSKDILSNEEDGSLVQCDGRLNSLEHTLFLQNHRINEIEKKVNGPGVGSFNKFCCSVNLCASDLGSVLVKVLTTSPSSHLTPFIECVQALKRGENVPELKEIVLAMVHQHFNQSSCTVDGDSQNSSIIDPKEGHVFEDITDTTQSDQDQSQNTSEIVRARHNAKMTTDKAKLVKQKTLEKVLFRTLANHPHSVDTSEQEFDEQRGINIVERQICVILETIIPFFKNQQQISSVADLRFIAELRNLILKSAKDVCAHSDAKTIHTFTRQLTTILDDSLAQYIGSDFIENREQIMFELSDILYNELAFYNLMHNIDNYVYDN